ncbi:uncharacterized protein EDB91DRAFT_1084144 [Suillus paluster]|uniref:uncharacterized protein n=1 Tax=Suillus paluster TaxID=48578 RepID=UPI001B860517|nr:uncharacterized protein EDB91DRAFT_1084144 [Suillus paluster]KAG1734241.1 hypothetical protein EDB91DRAFT_1084144 [Suillus paluster]
MSKMTRFTSLCKEITENILDSLDLVELSSLATMTSTLHTNIDEYIQRCRRIIFARFISNIQEFVGLLQGTGAVVSGSCALNLVQARQGAVAINDLDIYTTLQNFKDFVQFFTETEHYTVIRNINHPPPGPYNSSGMAKLFRLQNNGRNVDIIVTNLSSAISPIFQFHSTIVMNFISAEAVFCAYPGWTLDMAGLVHPRMYKQNATNFATVKGLAKYMQRGFTVYLEITELAVHESRCVKMYYCPQITRSTNDKGKLAWVAGHKETATGALGSANYIDTKAVIWSLGGDQCYNERVSGSPSFVFAT